MKKAFSMILSIIFLMVMAFIGIMVMSFTASTNRHVLKSYLDVKANLALRSATEYAILALQGHNFNNGNINEINLSYPFFNANIRFHYFLTNCTGNDCTKIETKDTDYAVLIYVIVTSKLPQFHIRKVKITLQNP